MEDSSLWGTKIVPFIDNRDCVNLNMALRSDKITNKASTSIKPLKNCWIGNKPGVIDVKKGGRSRIF